MEPCRGLRESGSGAFPGPTVAVQAPRWQCRLSCVSRPLAGIRDLGLRWVGSLLPSGKAVVIDFDAVMAVAVREKGASSGAPCCTDVVSGAGAALIQNDGFIFGKLVFHGPNHVHGNIDCPRDSP